MEVKKTGNRHRGNQVKRFRESIGMKQSVLAEELHTTQQNISYYEKQENLEDHIFEGLAKAMGVTPDVLNDFNSAPEVVNNIQEMNDNSSAGNGHPIYNFNPIEKIVEQASKIEELYKDLLASERDKITILNNALESLKNVNETLKNTIEKGDK